jgi:hypothetical protein
MLLLVSQLPLHTFGAGFAVSHKIKPRSSRPSNNVNRIVNKASNTPIDDWQAMGRQCPEFSEQVTWNERLTVNGLVCRQNKRRTFVILNPHSSICKSQDKIFTAECSQYLTVGQVGWFGLVRLLSKARQYNLSRSVAKPE